MPECSLLKNNPDYKLTPLGYIPVDWKIYDFGEVASRLNIHYVPKPDDKNIKCIELEHLSQVTGKLLGFVNAGEQKSTKNVFNKGNILFGKLRPYLRKYWLANFDGVCSSEIWVLYCEEKYLINTYLYYLVQTNQFIKTANTTSGTKMPRADWDYVALTPFPLPPLQEQKSIAQLLSVWDNAIEKTEQLLKLKEDYKKGLMQQLLTGKKRLKGFSGEWKEVKLGKIFTERNETNFPSLTLLSLGAIGIYPQSESIKKDTSNDDKSKYLRIMPGDIGYNTMRLWQGRCAFSEVEGILSPAYTVIIPNKYAYGKYFAYLFKLHSIIGLFFRYSQGLVDDTLNCKFHHFAQIHIEIPTFQEQTAIVEVLEKADKEIEIIKKEIEALKEQKKGLMQILLTGKVRLK